MLLLWWRILCDDFVVKWLKKMFQVSRMPACIKSFFLNLYNIDQHRLQPLKNTDFWRGPFPSVSLCFLKIGCLLPRGFVPFLRKIKASKSSPLWNIILKETAISSVLFRSTIQQILSLLFEKFKDIKMLRVNCNQPQTAIFSIWNFKQIIDSSVEFFSFSINEAYFNFVL